MEEDDVIDLKGMCKVLHKSSNTVRNLAKQKKIPAKLIAGSWYSSKLALSMCVAGYNPIDIYEKMAEKMLNKSSDIFV